VHAARRVDNRFGDADERRDASYFLGFVMTLVVLVYSLLRGGLAGITESWVKLFLQDLGAGLGLTVVGLTVRQFRVLHQRGTPRTAADDLVAAVGQLTPIMESLEKAVRGLATTPVGGVPQGLDHSVSNLESRINEAARKLGPALEKLNSNSLKWANDLEAASNRLGVLVTQKLELLETSVGGMTDGVTKAHNRLLRLLRHTTVRARATQQKMSQLATTQANEWVDEVNTLHAMLAAARAALIEESAPAFRALNQSSADLLALAHSVAEQVRQLPNPADRLHQLWRTVAEEEQAMSAAVGRTTTALDGLKTVAAEAEGKLRTLEQRAGGASTALTTGITELRQTLLHEARTLHDLVDEIYDAIVNRLDAIGRS
jgi:chromosome segregation ATPase